jgi:hypothetical protein
VNGGSITSWTFNSAALVLENDDQYQLTAKATDAAGNSNVSTTITFNYDIERPTSSVTSPRAGYATSLTSIAGTATDERFGVRTFEAKLGTYTVGVAIYEQQSDRW